MTPEKSGNIQLALLKQDVGYIKAAIDELKDALAANSLTYVSRSDFDPVKNIVYGLVGLILIGVVGAVVSLVIIK